jgi:hypothetical protein
MLANVPAYLFLRQFRHCFAIKANKKNSKFLLWCTTTNVPHTLHSDLSNEFNSLFNIPKMFPFEAQWLSDEFNSLLNIPKMFPLKHSGCYHCALQFKHSAVCLHYEFINLVWYLQQTMIISWNRINQLASATEIWCFL